MGWKAGIALSLLWPGYSRISDSIPDRDETFITSPQRPDRIWGTPDLLSNKFPDGGLLPGAKLPRHQANQSRQFGNQV
jgi:hypothetical protein